MKWIFLLKLNLFLNKIDSFLNWDLNLDLNFFLSLLFESIDNEKERLNKKDDWKWSFKNVKNKRDLKGMKDIVIDMIQMKINIVIDIMKMRIIKKIEVCINVYIDETNDVNYRMNERIESMKVRILIMSQITVNDKLKILFTHFNLCNKFIIMIYLYDFIWEIIHKINNDKFILCKIWNDFYKILLNFINHKIHEKILLN